jgi:hypothetical protein
MSDDDVNFLSRWSRRKAQVKAGGAPDPAPVAAAAPLSAATAMPTPRAPSGPSVAAGGDRAGAGADQPASPAQVGELAGANEAPPVEQPTLTDVAQLTHASDYSRFVAPGVDGAVRNAAMKKLFTDPHFNVMDGLDIYIDDYGKPDPLPASMLRQMRQSKFLGLFTEEEEAEEAKRLAEASQPASTAGETAVAADATDGTDVSDATDVSAVTVAEPDAFPGPDRSSTQDTADRTADLSPDSPSHENSDLRLQPNPAAGRTGAG